MYRQAQKLASKGRYGDTHLLHVNEDELRGIASIMPLSQNPHTGLPEAFSFKNLVPYLASGLAWGAGMGPMATALTSGLATTAVEGDLQKGLLSGLMSFGLGRAMTGAGKAGMESAMQDAVAGPLQAGAADSAWQSATMGERFKSLFSNPQALMSHMQQPGNLLPFAIGAGNLSQMNAQEAWQKQVDQRSADSEEKRRKAMEGWRQATQKTQYNPYGVPSYSQGGQVDVYSQGPDPAGIQQRLGGVNVAPPPGYVPGFNPEFLYFQNLQQGQMPQAPPFGPPDANMGMYNPFINQALFNPQPFFQQYLPPFNQWAQDENEFGNQELNRRYQGRYAGGGLIREIEELTQMNAGGQIDPVKYAGGGSVGIPSLGQGDPMGEAVQMLAQALSGSMPQEQADMIVQAFIQQFGQEAFAQAREAILGSGTQNEGMISGPGGGMDDQVMGTIAQQEPVAVSPGEYIVPADVVSGLGDGSSEAGAAELDQMSQRIRVARTGGAVQPPKLDKRVMPR